MSAELFRRALTEEDAKMFRRWIVDLEDVISNRESQIRELEAETIALKARIRELVCQLDAPLSSMYTPVNAPTEFTETPGTYIPISKPSNAEQRIRKALLTIDAATIKDWEDTEQALRKAAVGVFEDGSEHLVLPGEVHNSNSK